MLVVHASGMWLGMSGLHSNGQEPGRIGINLNADVGVGYLDFGKSIRQYAAIQLHYFAGGTYQRAALRRNVAG